MRAERHRGVPRQRKRRRDRMRALHDRHGRLPARERQRPGARERVGMRALEAERPHGRGFVQHHRPRRRKRGAEGHDGVRHPAVRRIDPVLRHAPRASRRRRYLQTIQWLINKFSRHMGESMVTVTTAAPLTDAQSERLAQIYSKKVGRPVHIHSVVDETVMGGMRIQVGDEVTDNTVIAQLQNLKRKVKAGTND